MKRLDSDLSLNFDTALEQDLKFLDNLLGNNSIHSHNSSTILDQKSVNFQDPGAALVDGESSYDTDGEIVYYHKDDMTRYSEGLDLNKVRRKKRRGKKKI
jgi:hypothetical protein